jgi:tryptophan 2,3-dioxygenase
MGHGNPEAFVQVTPGHLTYNDYLKVPELLTLQKLQSDPPHHDELLFIVIHQAYELWFKLVLHEIGAAIKCMDQKEVLQAHHFMKRVVAIMRLLVDQIHILETMTPADFMEFRYRLEPASGFQSLQFRELEYVAGMRDERFLKYFKDRPEMIEALKKRLGEPDVRHHYYEMLKKMGYAIPNNASKLEVEGDEEAKAAIIKALLPIYKTPAKNYELYLLSESLVEFDEFLSLWREHHVRVVERVIGFRRGTGGSAGAEYLKSTTSKRAFPYLWEVRSYLERGN